MRDCGTKPGFTSSSGCGRIVRPLFLVRAGLDRVRDALGIPRHPVNHRGRERVEEVQADEVEPRLTGHDSAVVHRLTVVAMDGVGRSIHDRPG